MPDCSVTMSWAFHEERDADADAILDLMEKGEAWVPSIWPLEVANCLLVGERMRRLSKTKVDYFTDRISKFAIQVRSIEFASIVTVLVPLAREHKLSSDDASYLDLAQREGLPLATRDQKLRLAALHCGVPLAGK